MHRFNMDERLVKFEWITIYGLKKNRKRNIIQNSKYVLTVYHDDFLRKFPFCKSSFVR